MKLNFPIRSRRKTQNAFSLLEVMIAIFLFFAASFTILQLVSQSVSNAHRLERPLVDASAVLSQLSLTNKFIEGQYSGNLADLMGKTYQDYTWRGLVFEVATNHLYCADFVVVNARNNEVVSRTSSLFYRPQSLAGSLDGGNFTR